MKNSYFDHWSVPADELHERLAVDKAALRDPRLLSPQQKPLGPVKVNHSHPLGKDVVHCFLFDSESCHDIVGGVRGIKAASQVMPDTKTKSADFGPQSNEAFFDLGTWPQVATPGILGGPWSFIVTVELPPDRVSGDFTEKAYILDNYEWSQTELFRLSYNEGFQEMRLEMVSSGGNSHDIRIQSTYPLDLFKAAPYSLGGAVGVNGDECRMYSTVGNHVDTNSVTAFPSTSGTRRMTVGSTHLVVDQDSNWPGTIHSLVWWNRALTYNEYLDFCKDPYQILTPA